MATDARRRRFPVDQPRFADGSIATIPYWANGPRSYPKERVEIFSGGRVLAIENWRALRAYDWRGAPRMRMRQDKGHRAQVAQFLERVAAGGPPLIPFDELCLVTAASFAAVRSAREGCMVRMDSTPAVDGVAAGDRLASEALPLA